MKTKTFTAASLVGGVALLFAGTAPAFAADTHTVCATGCDFTTIQAAVAAAAPGDTIDVGAGTYTGPIDLNKEGLILQGAQAGVDPRGGARGGESVISQGRITLSADNLTIDGFELTDAKTSAPADSAAVWGTGIQGTTIVNNYIHDNMFGLQFDNTGPAAALVQFNRIEDNNVNTPSGGSGVFMLGPSTGSQNVTITDNSFAGHFNTAINIMGHHIEITDNTSNGDATLIVMTDSSDVLIADNVQTHAGAGSGIFLGLGNDGVTVSGNQLQSDAAPADGTAAIRLSTAFGGPAASVNYTISDNVIEGGWSYSIRSSDGAYAGILPVHGNQFSDVIENGSPDAANLIDATGNWWDPAIDRSTMANVDSDPWCEDEACETSSDDPDEPALPATGVSGAAGLGAAAVAVAAGAFLMLTAGRRRSRARA